ncbi:MAG: hypothetical protein IJX87_00220 [Clostridia bacterium]|nr:hypothetical protein [Clostridia bacterium]
MRNIKKSILAVALVATTCASMALPVGCGKKGANVDSSKAQLHISNFNGGVGNEWLNKVINRFCADYATYKFTDDTQGVQVWVDNHTNDGSKIEASIEGAQQSIYFLEQTTYYNFVYNDLLLDITDMVQEKLTKYGENRSIEDKMTKEQIDFFKTSEGKYYGLPHYEGIYGITYDADLFEAQSLYFDAEGNLGKKSTDSGLGLGPNGKTGVIDGVDYSKDDGLPATYQQFFDLCKMLKKRGVAPMTWSGLNKFYSTLFTVAMKTDFEGLEQGTLMYTLNGTATKLVESISEDGVVTYKEPTAISEANASEIYSSAGGYYALKFMEEIIKNKWYDTANGFNEAITQKGAQEIFLQSRYMGEIEDVAMLVEGNWWMEEATKVFNDMSDIPGTSKTERNLKFMPYPKATEAQVGEKQTILSANNTLAGINANIAGDEDKVRLAKMFLQYCQTDESLIEFVETTNMFRGFQFDIPEARYNALTPYAKSNVDMMRTSDIVYPYAATDAFYNHAASLDPAHVFNVETGYQIPIVSFNEGKTALDYFNKLKTKKIL